MFEEHHAVRRGQRGRKVVSQVLAVAEAIAEQRGARTLANDADVVALHRVSDTQECTAGS